MTEFSYLLTEQFQTRYAITAFLLRDCEQIVEIGGYRTPISGFIKDKTVHVVGPKVMYSTSPSAFHHHMTFQNWKVPELNNYGLALLGLDIHGSDWQKLYDLIDRSTRTVIEVPVNYNSSMEQLEDILENVEKKIKFRIIMDFTEDPSDTKPSHDRIGPHGLRHIYVLED